MTAIQGVRAISWTSTRRSMSTVRRMLRRLYPTDEEVIKGRKLPDLMLYSFATKKLAEGWDLANDRRSGGKSEGSITWHPWEKGPQGEVDAQGWLDKESGAIQAAPWGHLQRQFSLLSDAEAPPLPEGGFLRFSGELSLERSAAAKRAGFCGARPQRRLRPFKLKDYTAIEMRVRTDGRLYEVNVEPDSVIPDDIYQATLDTHAGEWGTIVLPLDQLTLTGRGQYRVYQRALERAALHSIGLSISDGVAGPFQMDIAWISAIQEGDEEDNDDEPQRKMPPRPTNGVLEW